MAERTTTYSNVSRDQLRRMQEALISGGVQIAPVPTASPLPHPLDAGRFSTSGYEVTYNFAPGDATGQVGQLDVRVSGSMLFIGTAVARLDASIRPYLTVA